MTQIGDVSGYIVTYIDEHGLEQVVNVTSTDHTATISGLKPGTSYTFDVKTWSDELLSRNSTTKDVTMCK